MISSIAAFSSSSYSISSVDEDEAVGFLVSTVLFVLVDDEEEEEDDDDGGGGEGAGATGFEQIRL